MSNLAEEIATLIRLNGGEIVGKTRLQKTVYILESLGLGFDVEFDYHNFGPYSSDVALAVDDAEALGYIHSVEKQGNYHVPYTVFYAHETCPSIDDDLMSERRKQVLQKLQSRSALVLELAATALFLRDNGFGEDAWQETLRRKPVKATPSRIDEARKLVHELG